MKSWFAITVLAAAALASACAGDTAVQPIDPALQIQLANAGTQPMSCRLMFGHWVDRDLGMVAPGGLVSIEARQQPQDGALYIMRADGERRMMIETIACGRSGDWQASAGQVDLAPVRAARPREAVAACVLPATGRIRCTPPMLKP